MPEEVKEERWEILMGMQRAVSSHVLADRASASTIDVLVDEVDEEGAIARSAWDAPEIDGCVFLNGETHAEGRRQGPRADRARRRVRPVGRGGVSATIDGTISPA